MMIPNQKVVTTGAGFSDELILDKGDHLLIFTWTSTPGDADLQVGDAEGEVFVDAEDANGVVNIVSNRAVLVPGGVRYRVDVNSHDSALTIRSNRTTPLSVNDM